MSTNLRVHDTDKLIIHQIWPRGKPRFNSQRRIFVAGDKWRVYLSDFNQTFVTISNKTQVSSKCGNLKYHILPSLWLLHVLAIPTLFPSGNNHQSSSEAGLAMLSIENDLPDNLAALRA